ncbi:MAG: efflux transporter outer membrane subunit [Azoarcus sp.]|jgi:NodT family efflux transporter outer membrane factor (OMF) lipoprotein|nr:efflux transporter outer membrane subunit [Azoarcus sp.]
MEIKKTASLIPLCRLWKKGKERGNLPALICCAALLASACSFTEPLARPDMALPEQWQEAAPATGAAMPSADWWRGFGSLRLDALIAEAFAGNPDLRVQGERVIQAELALRAANASLFPSLNLSGNSGRNRNDPGSNSAAATSDRENSALNLAASYEVDLWGRVSADIASGKASLAASRHDYDGARLSLAASVATAWFQYLASVERLDIARENLAIAERVHKVVEARYRHGAVSALDLSRQTTTVLTQRAQIDPLEVQVRQTRMALDILCGRTPSPAAAQDTDTLAGLSIPAIEAGLPSELLLRRPDIASAESRLDAAAANVGAARAELFPRITLSAGGGLATDVLLSLAHPSSVISLSAALLQTVFDGGRLRAQVETARSQERELLETYRKTILAALKEVEDSLSNAARDTRQEEAHAQILAEAERGLRLAELRYSTGADDLLSVLDAQRTRFSVQDQLAQLRLARLTDAVNLFKALGGGWKRPEPDQP